MVAKIVTPGVCRFCGCTGDRACRLVLVTLAPQLDAYLLPPGIGLVRHGAETRIVPCEWLEPGLCSNPACVAKAYAEARTLAEELTIRQQIIAVAGEFNPAQFEQLTEWPVDHRTEYPWHL